MKLNCPACGEPFEDETELGATIKLVEHLRSYEELEHMAQLPVMMKELERLGAGDEIVKALALAPDDPRQVLFDRCARFDERLKGVQALAAGGLTVALNQLRGILQECSDYIGIRDLHAGQTLLRNLKDSLLVVERRYRH